VTVGKAQGSIARGGEAKEAIGPMVNRQDIFFEKSTHEQYGTELKLNFKSVHQS
jgi:hypothetical protein